MCLPNSKVKIKFFGTRSSNLRHQQISWRWWVCAISNKLKTTYLTFGVLRNNVVNQKQQSHLYIQEPLALNPLAHDSRTSWESGHLYGKYQGHGGSCRCAGIPWQSQGENTESMSNQAMKRKRALTEIGVTHTGEPQATEKKLKKKKICKDEEELVLPLLRLWLMLDLFVCFWSCLCF